MHSLGPTGHTLLLCRAQTCNFDALYAYLTCGNYDFNYDRSKNLRPCACACLEPRRLCPNTQPNAD